MPVPRAGAIGRAAFGLLETGLLLITPLVFHPGFSDQFTYPKVVLTKFIVLLGLVGLLLSIVFGWRRRSFNSGYEAPLAFLGLAVLASCLTSPAPDFSLIEAEYFLCGPLWLLLIISGSGGPSRVRWIAILVTIAAGLAAAVAVLQWAGQDPMSLMGFSVSAGTTRPSMRLYSTFGNPNFVAGYLIGAIFLAIPLLADQRKPALKMLAAIVVFVIFAAILGARSRGAWLGLAVGLFVVRRYWVRKTPVDEAAEPSASPEMLNAGLISVFPIALSQSVVQPLQVLLERFEGRAYMWRASWPMFLEHPFWGNGWGTFQLRFPDLQAEFLSANPDYAGYWTYTRRLHNDPLQILLEAGVMGFIAMVWLLWVYWSKVRKDLLRASPTERLWLAASIGGVTAIVVDSLFNFQLAIPPTLILLFTLLGLPHLLMSPKLGAVHENTTPISGRRVAFGALAGVFIVSGAWFVSLGIARRATAEHLLAQGMRQERRGAYESAEQSFRDGLSYAPADGRLHYALARAYYVDEQFSEALEEVQQAERTVADSHLLVLKARIQEGLDDAGAALETYRRAVWLDPSLRSARADIERLSQQRD